MMGDGFLPPDPFQLSPVWRNFFEDAGLVQFVHRMTGYLLVLFGLMAWWRARRSPTGAVRFGFNAVMAMLAVQTALWVLILRARFLAGYPPAQSVRG